MTTEYRRRITIFIDGTWEAHDDKTNVFRWFQHVYTSPITQNGESWVQIPGYFQGIGVHQDGDRNAIEAAFGIGIDCQILKAYQFISDHFINQEKDELWIIGFSRGAYASRSLVGMLYNVGLIPRSRLTPEILKEAYELYRHRSESTRPESSRAIEFRKKYHCLNPKIRFLGCFDTVGALGVPKLPNIFGGSLLKRIFYNRYQFHDTRISPWVQSAFHALSIHEQRQWFTPVFMRFAKKPKFEQELLQLWFAGAHEDVGGGSGSKLPFDNDSYDGDDPYNNESTFLLPNQSLKWMMTMAIERGFVFNKSIDNICHGGKFILRDSYTDNLVYRLLPRRDRVIQPEIFGTKALYNNGKFDYLTIDQLVSYPSETLDTYIDYLEKYRKTLLDNF